MVPQKTSNIKKLQAFQSKFLRLITGAPFYVSNATLHSDLNVPYVEEYAKSLFNSFYNKLEHHTNPKISSLQKSVSGSEALKAKLEQRLTALNKIL